MFSLTVGFAPAPAVDLPMIAAAVLAAAGLLAMLPRRVLPRGLPEGLFITAMTALAVQFGRTGVLPAWTMDANAGRRWGPLITIAAMSAMWYLVGCAVDLVRRWPGNQTADHTGHILARAARRADRVTVWFWASAVCGLLAAAGTLNQPAAPAWLVLVILLAFILPGWLVWRGWPEGFAAIALILWLVLQAARFGHWPLRGEAAWLPLVLGGLALALVITMVVADWFVRSRAWSARPYQAPPPQAPRITGHAAALALSAAGGIAALPFGSSYVAVFSAALCAYAAFGVAHRTGWTAGGWLGLLLAAQAVVALALASLPSGPLGAAGGLALAAGFLLWLALFWRQQLDDGHAWTTAGRLIAPARRLAGVLTAAAFVFAAAGLDPFACTADPRVPTAGASRMSGAIVMAILLGLAALWLRAHRESDDAGAEFLACLAAAALGLLGAGSDLLPDAARKPGACLAAAGLLLALRICVPWGRTAPGTASLALVGGVLPALTVIDFWRHGPALHVVVALVVSAMGAALVLLAVRTTKRHTAAAPAETRTMV